MANLVSQILSTNFTKSAALVALSDAEDKVRSRELSEDEYTAAKTAINAIEPLHLELAIELNEKQLKELVTKLRGDYGENFLVETTTSPELIGGARVSYKGVLKDYSVRNNINVQ
jgi:F0F1-type ATP synthase delta subunit